MIPVPPEKNVKQTAVSEKQIERKFLRRGTGHVYDPRKAVLEEKERQRRRELEEQKTEHEEEEQFSPQSMERDSKAHDA